METLLGNETAGKILTKDTACPSLTVKQRFYGFIGCLIFGLLCAILAIVGIYLKILPAYKFAILYSLGNLSAIGSTLFLVGPSAQLKRMFKETRIVATILFLGSLIGTLVFVFLVDMKNNQKWWHRLALFGLIALQFFTLFWYTLSYVPFGRRIFKKICCAICCSEDEKTGGLTAATKS